MWNIVLLYLLIDSLSTALVNLRVLVTAHISYCERYRKLVTSNTFVYDANIFLTSSTSQWHGTVIYSGVHDTSWLFLFDAGRYNILGMRWIVDLFIGICNVLFDSATIISLFCIFGARECNHVATTILWWPTWQRLMYVFFVGENLLK